MFVYCIASSNSKHLNIVTFTKTNRLYNWAIIRKIVCPYFLSQVLALPILRLPLWNSLDWPKRRNSYFFKAYSCNLICVLLKFHVCTFLAYTKIKGNLRNFILSHLNIRVILHKYDYITLPYGTQIPLWWTPRKIFCEITLTV